MNTLPWWVAGAGLAAVAVGHWLAERRPLGVSGVVGRFANLRSELEAERTARLAPAGDDALAQALEAATAEALAEGELTPASLSAAPPVPTGLGPPAPLVGHLVFLLALGAGGLVAKGWGTSLAEVSSARVAAVAAAGGILMGFGSSWMGGCTTGHGITGCARLMPGSLLATAVFLAVAVGLTLALRGAGVLG